MTFEEIRQKVIEWAEETDKLNDEDVEELMLFIFKEL